MTTSPDDRAAAPPTRIEYNSSGTMALEVTAPPVEQSGAQLSSFRVLRVADSTVLYRGDFMRGYVKWIDDSTLERFSTPQKLREDADLSAYKTHIKVSLQPPVEK